MNHYQLDRRSETAVHSWPFRCYLRFLSDNTGYSWRILAVAMDVAASNLQPIVEFAPGYLFLPKSLGRRILDFTPDSLLRLGAEQIPAKEVRNLYIELRLRGASHRELAAQCHMSNCQLDDLIVGNHLTCSRWIKWTLLALLEVYGIKCMAMRNPIPEPYAA